MNTKYSQIYLDYNATTPCDKAVVAAMLPYFSQDFGNASSGHHPYGWLAMDAIEETTNTIAASLDISPKEITYTSGSTESINSILKGVFQARKAKRNHIITSKAEHKAVLDVCASLEKEGAEITYLDVDVSGLIDIAQLEAAISEQTSIVALMLANNETGVIQPLEAIANLCNTNGCLLFSDATQALGKIPLYGFFECVDFACFSAHKIYGPKGIGFTYSKSSTTKALGAYIHGGGQQEGRRGGTYNTPAIIGKGIALELALKQQQEITVRLSQLRNHLQEGLSTIEESVVNCASVNRLPNTLNMSFKYVDGQQLLRALSRHLAISNGSACNSAAVNPSHVLTAMGISKALAFSSLRFSLGKYTTAQEIEKTIAIVIEEVAKQRASNILWERR